MLQSSLLPRQGGLGKASFSSHLARGAEGEMLSGGEVG